MYTVRFNLVALVGKLQAYKGRKYTWKEISELSGISRGTLHNIQHNKTDAVENTTISALLRFFEREGMPITVGDLYEVYEVEEFAPEAR